MQDSTSCILIENKKLVHIKHKSIKNMTESEFGAYLAGLWEADGHFSKQQQIVFAFHKLDLELSNRLCTFFGHGHVSRIKGKEAYKWVISNIEGIIKFLNLIDGHLRLPEKLLQIQTNVQVDKILKLTNFSQKEPKEDISSLTSSYWLAGFTDGDGSFYIQMSQRDKSGRTEIRLHYKVAVKYPDLLNQLSRAFGSSVHKRSHVNKEGQEIYTYYWSSTSFENAYKVHKYFHRYHLQSSKYLNFYKWRKALRLIYEQKHTTSAGIAEIRRLKDSMNSKLILKKC